MDQFKSWFCPKKQYICLVGLPNLSSVLRSTLLCLFLFYFSLIINNSSYFSCGCLTPCLGCIWLKLLLACMSKYLLSLWCMLLKFMLLIRFGSLLTDISADFSSVWVCAVVFGAEIKGLVHWDLFFFPSELTPILTLLTTLLIIFRNLDFF